MNKPLNLNEFDVLVIGGGASGMMAAGVAAADGKNVLIIEKNKSLGEKLKITGGGRCNITNAEYDIRALLKNYGPASEFLYSPFSQFGVKESFSFFESLGLPIVVQGNKRAFPQTEKALDVFNVLKKYLDKNNVAFQAGCTVKKIIHKDGKITGIETNQGIYTAKSYILATGGMSHPETGSTGDGFKWLADLGHKVKKPLPTIVPLKVEEQWIKMLAGVSVENAKITFYPENNSPEIKQKKLSKTGKILFTHFGLSGPTILNISSKVGEFLEGGEVKALIDLFPNEDIGTLEKNIIKVFDANKNKILRTVFRSIAPAGTTKGIETLLPDIDFETKVHSITKEERKKITHLLKALPVTITSLMGYDRAVVADGGVLLDEIDTKTMRSKLFENLYVTGDLLHINRPSGGFSLQLCWTTGFVAGKSA